MHETIRRLHKVLYIFPITLLCLDAILSLYNLITDRTSCVAFYLFGAGLATGWLSLATGLATFFWLKASNVAKGLAFIHGFINSMALLVLTVLWTQDAKNITQQKSAGTPSMVFKLLMIGLLLAGSYLGKSALRKQLKRTTE